MITGRKNWKLIEIQFRSGEHEKNLRRNPAYLETGGGNVELPPTRLNFHTSRKNRPPPNRKREKEKFANSLRNPRK